MSLLTILFKHLCFLYPRIFSSKRKTVSSSRESKRKFKKKLEQSNIKRKYFHKKISYIQFCSHFLSFRQKKTHTPYTGKNRVHGPHSAHLSQDYTQHIHLVRVVGRHGTPLFRDVYSTAVSHPTSETFKRVTKRDTYAPQQSARDSQAVLVPCLEDVFLNKQPNSKT